MPACHAPRTVVFHAPDHQPMPSPETPVHSQACLAQSLVGSLLLSPGSWCTQGFVCPVRESVSLVLWKFCNQIPLAFKFKFSGVSQSLCWIFRLEICCGSQNFCKRARLLWCKCSPICGLSAWHLYSGVMVTSSKRTYATPPRSAVVRDPVPAAGHC